jgi:hypothetical protein
MLPPLLIPHAPKQREFGKRLRLLREHRAEWQQGNSSKARCEASAVVEDCARTLDRSRDTLVTKTVAATEVKNVKLSSSLLHHHRLYHRHHHHHHHQQQQQQHQI